MKNRGAEGPLGAANDEKQREKPVYVTGSEEIPHKSWPITFGENGRIQGLPEEKSEKDVIVFKGSDGKWYAQNPSLETLKEIGLWRTDYQNPIS